MTARRMYFCTYIQRKCLYIQRFSISGLDGAIHRNLWFVGAGAHLAISWTLLQAPIPPENTKYSHRYTKNRFSRLPTTTNTHKTYFFSICGCIFYFPARSGPVVGLGHHKARGLISAVCGLGSAVPDLCPVVTQPP